MVHDMKNLTFSEEICGCSAWTPTDLLQGGRESSAWVVTIFPRIWVENGGTRRRTSSATTM